MVPSSNRRQKVQISKVSANERSVKGIESSTNMKPHAKELPLRTSLVRCSVKKRIFAYMDMGDRSADIETKSGLSHLIVKHYRRMWKDERHDARLRSMKRRSRRKACSRAPSYEPVRLPLRLKPGCGQRPESCQGAKSVGDKGTRKHRAAGGFKERDAKPERKGAGSGGQETGDLRVEGTNSPVASETQLVIRLMEKPAAR